jgi:PAS domain S-box-containing protein
MAGNAIAHAQLFLEIQAAEARYLALFEDSIDPILITDLAGRITGANAKAVEFLGYSRDELKGLVIGNVHRMGTGPIGEQRFSHITGGREVSFETRMTNKHGEAVPVEVHAKRIIRGGQEFIQWIQRDISERLALEETRSDLISMIVHDLRSPLGNIVSSLDVLQATLTPDDEVVVPVLAIAFRSSQRLSRLIDSLLDLRRLEAGQAVLHKDPASINALIAEAADQVHPLAEGKAILLRLDVPPRLPAVPMDADMIRRVLINLMENAVKYSESAGTIVVSARTGDGLVTIGVKDSGPGVPLAEHARIFQKFTRLQSPAGPKGLGLGLAFCKLAVEAHRGRIWVESEPGQGATFFFTLPIS